MDPSHPGTRFRVRRVDETGSTNADVLAEARAGAAEGLVIVAHHQTAGRGRAGRTWVAPPGEALLMSVLLRPKEPHLAVCAVGCAAAAACEATTQVEPGLKWPNDLVLGGRKLGGILAEAEAQGNLTAVVVGLGLNVGLPPDLPEATSLRQHGATLSVDALLAELLDQLERRLDLSPERLLAEYRRRCVTVGQRVRVEQPNETWEGDAVAIDDSAALLVDRPGRGQVRVDVGDVIHLRPA